MGTGRLRHSECRPHRTGPRRGRRRPLRRGGTRPASRLLRRRLRGPCSPRGRRGSPCGRCNPGGLIRRRGRELDPRCALRSALTPPSASRADRSSSRSAAMCASMSSRTAPDLLEVGAGRVGDVPVDVAAAREDGAGVAAAHGDHHVGAGARPRRSAASGTARTLDTPTSASTVATSSWTPRSPGCAPGRGDQHCAGGSQRQESSGHLRASGVGGAHEQHQRTHPPPHPPGRPGRTPAAGAQPLPRESFSQQRQESPAMFAGSSCRKSCPPRSARRSATRRCRLTLL